MSTINTKRTADRRTEGSLHGVVRCITISNQLLDNLSVQKRLHGSRWREVMADLGTALQLHMKATGESNPINAALPIAKKMSAAGENPMIFIAVATELANTPNNAAMSDCAGGKLKS